MKWLIWVNDLTAKISGSELRRQEDLTDKQRKQQSLLEDQKPQKLVIVVEK